jgi:hypothetical protein
MRGVSISYDRPRKPGQKQFNYCTLTVTVAMLRPYWPVAYSVYVVVCVGLTSTLVPRTAPT